ncbi:MULTISPECIES: GtrA family protein [Pantoea]|uniref:GtrA family protein n=1 Tax=Pantoea TaxID=53335 RepID=UPI001912D411|nr:GtrA family protein [Pantoea vagans]
MSTTSTRSQAVRYALVGLANTGITALFIFILMHWGVGIYASNAAGYIAGILFSFVANSLFTFSANLSIIRFARFFMSSLFCWMLNILAIKLFLIFAPSHAYIAQLFGMAIYTAAGFLINKIWVMKK